MPATDHKIRSLQAILGPVQGITREELTAEMRALDLDLWIHAGLVAENASRMAAAFQLAAGERSELVDAAWLHDLGKLTIARALLDKPGNLDPGEWIEMHAHAERGAAYLGGNPRLQPISPLVRHHHERFDGSGYPDRLAGAAIPFGSRIICLIDAFDAMTTERPYRAALPFEDALVEIARCAGTQFDPLVANKFLLIAHDLRKGAHA